MSEKVQGPSLWAYIELARLHRPIGIWLTLFPSLWGLSLATGGPLPLGETLCLCLGAVLSRSAGCVYNDWVDRDLDRQVRRTAQRPLASGDISKTQGKWLFLGLLLGAFGVLLTLPWPSIFLGMAALPLILVYPWMKRITYWPQAFLGITFNWGLWIGYYTHASFLSEAAVFLYLGSIFWTLGYDTLYAHQDKEDDQRVGAKSTTLLFPNHQKHFLSVVYSVSWLFYAWAGLFMKTPVFFYLPLFGVGILFFVQIHKRSLNNSEACLKGFKLNQWVGALILLGIWMSSQSF